MRAPLVPQSMIGQRPCRNEMLDRLAESPRIRRRHRGGRPRVGRERCPRLSRQLRPASRAPTRVPKASQPPRAVHPCGRRAVGCPRASLATRQRSASAKSRAPGIRAKSSRPRRRPPVREQTRCRPAASARRLDGAGRGTEVRGDGAPTEARPRLACRVAASPASSCGRLPMRLAGRLTHAVDGKASSSRIVWNWWASVTATVPTRVAIPAPGSLRA